MVETTIKQLAEKLQAGEATARNLAEQALATIEEKDGEINAFLHVDKEQVLAQADAADNRIQEGNATPLTGIPIAIKDNILVSGQPATAASRILKDHTASYDATAITRLKKAGAVVLGKTNLDEFAMGASTENSAFGATKNPHDTTRVPGGSSGGSAAAVAAGMCPVSLGSDTAGSIRQPASFCGVVGMKPTYGAVSRSGLIALASSFDQIGPFARNVEDAELVYHAIRGKDILDATSLEHKDTGTPKAVADITIGVPKEYFAVEGLSSTVKEKVEEAISWYKEQGARVQEVSLPHSVYGVPTYYILMPAEASSNLARYDGIRYGSAAEADTLWGRYKKTRGEGFGPEPLRRIMTGTFVLSAGYFDAYYKKAKAVQQRIKQEFAEVFNSVDVLMTPTAPNTAFKLGEKKDDPLALYAQDVFTVPLNIAGLPGISVPCGEVDGLPTGLQIIAPWRQEAQLFAVAKKYDETHNNVT